LFRSRPRTAHHGPLAGGGTVVPVTNLQIKFPVIGLKIPVHLNNFPVSLSRELLDKWLQHSGFWRQNPSPKAPKLRNSLLNSLITGISTETGSISTAPPGWESGSNRNLPNLQLTSNLLNSFGLKTIKFTVKLLM
jgi:hypothetical protein